MLALARLALLANWQLPNGRKRVRVSARDIMPRFAFIWKQLVDRSGEDETVLRFTIRELLWLTLAVAITCGWWLESVRAHQWRQRAELAVGVLEAECLSRMV